MSSNIDERSATTRFVTGCGFGVDAICGVGHALRMKIVLALAASLALVTPALACPNMDHDDNAPKTAEKKPADKKQEQPKADKDQKAPDTAKKKDDKSTEKKPGDKVSMK